MPNQLREPLQAQLVRAQQLHQGDLEKGYGAVYLPFALERKYPNAHREWLWQYVFPSDRLSPDPRSPGVIRRHHVDESGLQKAVRRAAQQAAITKPVGPHTFRHSFATHLLDSGYDIAPHSGERETRSVSPVQAPLAPVPSRSSSATPMCAPR